MPNEFVEAAKTDSADRNPCTKHVNDLHGKVKARAAIVKTNAQVSAAQEKGVVCSLQPRGYYPDVVEL
jgi:hypothetical protein